MYGVPKVWNTYQSLILFPEGWGRNSGQGSPRLDFPSSQDSRGDRGGRGGEGNKQVRESSVVFPRGAKLPTQIHTSYFLGLFANLPRGSPFLSSF